MITWAQDESYMYFDNRKKNKTPLGDKNRAEVKGSNVFTLNTG